MKKILIFVIMCLFIPFNCWAAEKITINDVTVKGPNSVEEGKYFTIKVSGDYSGFNRKDFGVLGIAGAGIEFEYDEDVLVWTEYYTESYDSEYEDIDGVHVLFGNAIFDGSNKCANGFLNCGPYTAELTFYVKNTDAEETTITINGVALLALEVMELSKYADGIDEDDFVSIEYDKSKTLTLKIKQNDVDEKVPNGVAEGSLPSIDEAFFEKAAKDNSEVKSEDKSEDSSKSDEKKELKFLKSLTVKDHKLDFKENRYTYEISLSDDVNKLDIEAIPYDSNATVKIVGADDLKTYSDIIKVRVELPGHEKTTYVINIKRESLSSRESKSIVNKLNTVAAGIGGGVLFILIIVWFACSRDKKKLKKLLNDSKNENEMF